MNVCILALALMVLILPGLAKARTFNLLNDDFALYVKGSVDTKSYKNTLVSDSNGAGINMDSEGTNKISGEFGIFFAEPKLNVRLGIEYLRPHALEDKQGLRATDDVLMYTMKSELSVLAPKIVIELNLQRSATSRLFVSAGGGYAMLRARNDYSLTDAGRTQFTPLTEFDEQLSATSFLYEGSVGYENLLADTTTFVIEAGYRSLVFSKIQYDKATTNFQGSQDSGAAAKNSDDSGRSLDLSGINVALTLRIWL